MDEAEHRRVRADTEGQDRDGERREGRPADEHSYAELQILPEHLHPPLLRAQPHGMRKGAGGAPYGGPLGTTATTGEPRELGVPLLTEVIAVGRWREPG